MSLPRQTVYLKDYQPVPFRMESVDLRVELSDALTVVTAELRVSRRDSELGQPLVLHGECLSLQSIMLDGVELAAEGYELTETSLTVLQVPETFVIKTVVHIIPQENKSMMGLYRSRGNYCTQCEAQGFRKITYFIDRPDIMTRFTTTVVADKARYPYLLSNGNLIERGETDDGQHWVKWQDPSLKPCYLFALVAGDFDVLSDAFETASGREVKLEFYLEKGFGEQGHFALESLKRAMAWDEENYGREYDLDIYMVVAVSDFNMGAMENKGLNVFNTKYVLANSKTATDADYVAIEDVIGHEYFHNWTGNRVTCRDWFQLTLKEGLTVFRDQTFSEDMTSVSVARINEVNVVRNAQFAEDAGPLSHPIRPPSYMEINNFYTSTVYRKGAEVIRMIHTLIGQAAFRQGMDIYFQRHDGQAVTTEDFVAAMESSSGRDLTQFKRWYSQPGTPTLTLTSVYDEDNKLYQLTVKQSCRGVPGYDTPEPFHMPLVLGFVDASGGEVCLHCEAMTQRDDGKAVLELTKEEHSFVFHGASTCPVLSINRGFSAPVNIDYAYSDADLSLLMIHDTDPVARWNASQLLSESMILSLAKKIQAGEKKQFDNVMIETWREVITSANTDGNLLAQLCSLPMINYLLRRTSDADIAALFAAKKFIMEALSMQLQDCWLQVYQDLCSPEPYQYSVGGMANRAWKNRCLYFLVRSDPASYAKRAFEQLQDSDNMTDSMGALMALTHVDSSYRDQALSLFYQRWHHEPLVYNKWLAVQARSIRVDTLDQVQALLSHELFDAKNPNNVYALLCEFGNNPVALHLNDEQKGYQLLADQVIQIDSYNPQVAARLLSPLTRWQQLDEQRGARMLAQLERIAQQPSLSSDVAEIVQKSVSLQ